MFSNFGELKRCGIHWDAMGNSKGTADVEYLNADDARKAIEELDSKKLFYFSKFFDFLILNKILTIL
jgi:RNA recognition motif-containing protein